MYTASAEVALVNGDLTQAKSLAVSAEKNTHTLLEKVRIMSVRMDCYVIQNQLDQAIELGIAALRLSDFELDVEKMPSSAVEKLFQLPEMTDPRALTVCRFAEPLISAAFARSTVWLEQFVHFYLQLFSKFGNPPVASFIYIAYAVQLISQVEELEQGCRIGRMALELAERQGASKILYIVRFVYYAFIHHWLAPAREGVVPLEENVQPAFESGNPRYSISSQDIGVKNSLFVGYKLEQVRTKYEEAIHRLATINQSFYNYRLNVWSKVVMELMGKSLPARKMNNNLFNRQQMLVEAGQNQMNKFNLYAAEAYLSLFLREKGRALEASATAQTVRVGANTHLILAQHVFVHSLALLSSGLDDNDLPARLATLEENLHLLRVWARLVPQNFLHQLQLVEAEQARCLRRDEQAAKSYEQAIQNARRNGYIHESALAAELAAEFYLAREQYPIAIDHLCTAYYGYLAWGATMKVADLIDRYPDWLPPGKDNERRNTLPTSEESPAEQIGSSIDLSTILKASMELAQETSLEVLLRKMMAILIENAGAQNGSLLLIQNDRWILKVQGTTNLESDFAILSTPLEYLSPQIGKFYLPISIIHYVINFKNGSRVGRCHNFPPVLPGCLHTKSAAKIRFVRPTHEPGHVDRCDLPGEQPDCRCVYLQPPRDRTTAFGPGSSLDRESQAVRTMEIQVQERTRELSDANRRLKEEISQRIKIRGGLAPVRGTLSDSI